MISIDVFNHCLPAAFIQAVQAKQDGSNTMFERAAGAFPAMTDLDARFRMMDEFPGYQQVISLASPAVEALAGSGESPELARIGNDLQAEWVAAHPDRFPGFIASLPMNNPKAALAEAQRALTDLKAVGIQLYTHVNGQPLDQPEFLPLFEWMAGQNRPIWLHPLRPASTPDYPCESSSKYDSWWALGWPYETGVAMMRLVFAGIFDRWPDLKIITHHVGGIIPMMEGRLDSGLKLFKDHYSQGNPEIDQPDLLEKPVDAFRRFYADTASFGSALTIEAGRSFFGIDHMLFATDFPFDHQLGTAHIGNTLKAIDSLNLPEEEKEKILSGNFRRILQF